MARDFVTEPSPSAEPKVSSAKAASVSRAAPRLDVVDLLASYTAAYEAANKCQIPYRVTYENGWFVFRYRNGSMRLNSVRAAGLAEMAQTLKARAAQAGEARQGQGEEP